MEEDKSNIEYDSDNDADLGSDSDSDSYSSSSSSSNSSSESEIKEVVLTQSKIKKEGKTKTAKVPKTKLVKEKIPKTKTAKIPKEKVVKEKVVKEKVLKTKKPSSEVEKIEQINIDEMDTITEYPEEFVEFAKANNLAPPRFNSKNGKALSAMLNNPYKYWNRESADQFVKKFGIETKDSIQLFNKHEQWGIKTSNQRGKNYILYPYSLSNKHKMRKDFKFDGSAAEKNAEIDKIKSTIQHDYVDVPNESWQLGHKNPESDDNKSSNLILQPPIQAKYRDKYIFIDTLTKIPTPKTIIQMYNLGGCPYTTEQLVQLKDWLNGLSI
jgi:hypothetical protein